VDECKPLAAGVEQAGLEWAVAAIDRAGRAAAAPAPVPARASSASPRRLGVDCGGGVRGGGGGGGGVGDGGGGDGGGGDGGGSVGGGSGVIMGMMGAAAEAAVAAFEAPVIPGLKQRHSWLGDGSGRLVVGWCRLTLSDPR